MSIVISGTTGINTVSENIITSIAEEVTIAALPQMFDAVSTEVGNIVTGRVLQVVSTLTSAQTSQSITTTDTQLGGLTHTITPKGNNSKFLVTVRWFGEVGSGWETYFNIHQDGVRVNSAGGISIGLYMPTLTYQNDNSSTPEMANFSTLVNTSSTIGTPITYTAVVGGISTRTLWNNRTFSTPTSNFESGTSEIIIMEVAA